MMKRYLFSVLTIIVLVLLSCVKKPEAGFEISSGTVFVGEEVYFMNTSDNQDNLLWNFGDSITSSEDSPKHAYLNPGKYTVTLTAYSKNGKKESVVSKQIEVVSTTKELITGTWRLKRIYTSQHDSVDYMINDIYPCSITIDENTNITSTAGHFFLYLAFGNWHYSQFMDSLNTFFQYENSGTTNGSMDIDDLSTIEVFSLNMDIELNDVHSWDYIFQECGYNPVTMGNSIINFAYSYIALNISDADPDKMIWKTSGGTVPVYTYTDTSGVTQICPSMYAIDLKDYNIVFEKE